VRRTAGTEFGYLPTHNKIPTPTASDYIERKSTSSEKINPLTNKSVDLPDWVGFWPTPTKDMIFDREKKYSQGGTPLTAAVKVWATPQAHDRMPGRADRVGRAGTKHGCRNLNDEVAREIMPTPTVGDSASSGSRNTSDSKAHPGVSLTDHARGDGGRGRTVFPTPIDMSKGGGSSRSGDRINEIPTLDGMARKGMWPTPKSAQGGPDFAIDGRQRSGSESLVTAVNREIMPTPTGTDHKGRGGGSYGRHAGLDNHVKQKPWISPASRDWKDTPGMALDTDIREQNREDQLPRQVYATSEESSPPSPTTGCLNPTWVEWLMGYPIGFTDLNCSEIPSCRRWPFYWGE
jgi:hypothetical protein